MLTLAAQPARTSTSRVRIKLAAAAITAVGLLLTLPLGGCAGANTALQENNRALTERNTALVADNESLNNLVQQLQAAVSARDKALAEANSLISDLRSGKSGLESRIAAMGNLPDFGNLTALDANTDQALKDLAAQHSDILEYDAARGLIRFKSDVTFDSGSDVVRESAKSTLSQLAGILNGAAAQYDVRIVGHTDAQRLSSATATKHTTNLRLSADRSISVRNDLVRSGVSAPRFEIGGRGEFDPLVPNAGKGNTPQNRRVEVYLVKATSKIGVSSQGDTPAPTPSKRAAPAPAAKPASSGDDVLK